ncbi:transmembrane protein 165 [Nasonia vitripennis]|uniref:GDT1 family protein n=1 Tax=Nasonia vitripennis TaxID=7425 RepID=A0A7M7QZP0_NASVI|nr:transmembrane protein 165 [Nasonia vitripennis]XP_032456250.1 transmembrane protein 165 [Nasonia vitripennis]XP_032456251.1 transmembrane protein 165 [Nasonia vitripennis]XP_032456252.1 transmembrane protein 165 [Nasonia vitripennis]XP_032456253.1 transmembrane protein 165 [Nasonia vitripennis]XP_032456254.1 transmembrane protein 165 [Nasonia vitripennis]
MTGYRDICLPLICFYFMFNLTYGEKMPSDVVLERLQQSSSSSDRVDSVTPMSALENLGFLHAFLASLSVIVVSELGDKTFFIAAIMAMRHPRLTVFAGAISALAVMTVLSVIFGYAATIIPRAYTYYISTALFALFGLKMLRDGYYMSPNEGQEELEEVQSDLRKREDEFEKETSTTLVQDPETGVIRKSQKTSAFMLLSRIFLQAFSLTFLAEWGDRSQITTIILAAREDVYGVVIGGVLGHSFCTGLAVLGGRMIAQRISVRTVTIIGGVVFLIFALTALFVKPTDTI